MRLFVSKYTTKQKQKHSHHTRWTHLPCLEVFLKKKFCKKNSFELAVAKRSKNILIRSICLSLIKHKRVAVKTKKDWPHWSYPHAWNECIFASLIKLVFATDVNPPYPSLPALKSATGSWELASDKLRREDENKADTDHKRVTFNNFKYFWLSFQSSFHLSFAVLVCYRSPIGLFSFRWNLPPKLFRAAISSNPTQQASLIQKKFVLIPKKVFFSSSFLKEEGKEKSNGGFTLYAVPFQGSLVFSHGPSIKKNERPMEKIVLGNTKQEEAWKTTIRTRLDIQVGF